MQTRMFCSRWPVAPRLPCQASSQFGCPLKRGPSCLSGAAASFWISLSASPALLHTSVWTAFEAKRRACGWSGTCQPPSIGPLAFFARPARMAHLPPSAFVLSASGHPRTALRKRGRPPFAPASAVAAFSGLRPIPKPARVFFSCGSVIWLFWLYTSFAQDRRTHQNCTISPNCPLPKLRKLALNFLVCSRSPLFAA